MQKQFVFFAALATATPGWAATKEVPNLSGEYTYTKNIACWSGAEGSVPSFTQEVGIETFSPQTGKGTVAVGTNYLVAGVPVYFQTERNIGEDYAVRGQHKMTLGGSDAYVQFGRVVNGVAASAYLLYKNADASCTIQASFTAVNS